ncbi:hypothetical protein G3I59_32290 [Amycolatopsis rubida]|uniref:Uncharacterized protein n=1 Tax=Amycolatopsis rubida TaxID=112413 RepID=A0ABX0BJ19_9PSEU|nr:MULTISPECIES: hypothetical protein [Amycolatopsis]MYW90480.1 hypothetical protein [Amycolatopsis rubida]MYW95152.1 hypothetical protein [Amycolatopsis rubida]NEC55459.1 hypothetical protein [Amycolatopsis rubida]NEC60140.1 hypothetical protein [Amycolatopsis rubida]OAP25026.1 hypothetical protein A4R44_04095 [Amycolatopsis sp. M39]
MDTNNPVSGSEQDRQYAIFRDCADQYGVQRTYQALSTMGTHHELLVSLAVRYLAESGPQRNERPGDETVFAYATEHGHVRVIPRWRGLWHGLAFCSVEPDETEQWHRDFSDAERWLSRRAALRRTEE